MAITDQELTTARLAVNDWHACATNEELARWRAAQYRLIEAAKATVYPEVEALRAERDALVAERDALKAQIEDALVWMERVAAGRKCSCWLGTSSTFGSSDARRACAVHGDKVQA